MHSHCFYDPKCVHVHVFYLQKDVVAESANILKLGLLFGEDIQATTEDLPAMLSFQHKLLQEYLAAVYIAEHVKLDTTSTFLTEAFPTWEKIENHREVVQFACGILGDTDAHPITYHVAKVLAQHTHNQLNAGVQLSIIGNNALSLLRLFEREGKVSLEINPYLCEYPACGRPLAEVLANTELAYITDIDKNDTLELNTSPAQIIVNLNGYNWERSVGDWFDRLWQSLYQIQAHVIGLRLVRVRSANVTKLSQFPQLKYLFISGNDCNYSDVVGEDLAESINAWGTNPQLTYCWLQSMPIPTSLMTGLSKCTHLLYVFLGSGRSDSECNLHEKLSVMMTSPPPALRYLSLCRCSLRGSDVDHIIQAIREGRLPSLQKLDVSYNNLHGSDVDKITQVIREGHLTSLQVLGISLNPVGEAAVGRLLETIISTSRNIQLTLGLMGTGVDENGEYTDLSDEFEAEWKAKLTGTNINVEWY